MIPALLLLLASSLAAGSAPEAPSCSGETRPAAHHQPAGALAPSPEVAAALHDRLSQPDLPVDPQERHLALRRLLDAPAHTTWARSELLDLVREQPTHSSWRDTYERLLEGETDAVLRAELAARRDEAAIRRDATRAPHLDRLRQAVAEAPQDRAARRLLAEALLREGEPSGALAVLLRGPPDPDAAELRYLATLGSRALSGEPLLRLARDAGRDAAPDDGVGAAQVLEEAGYSAAAEVALKTHAGTPSTSPRALKHYCRLLLDRGETERAEVLLAALLRVHPDDDRAAELLARARQPWSPETLDLAGLRQALNHDPGDVQLLTRWARLSLEAGHDPLRGLLFGAAHAPASELERLAPWIATAHRARGDRIRARDPEAASVEYALAGLAWPERDPVARMDRALRLSLYRAHDAGLRLARARWLRR